MLPCAERRLFLPRWSKETLAELARTLQHKLGRSPQQVDHLLQELNAHFADALVENYEPLMGVATNDPGDRHVLAAAIKCGAEAIVTFNLKHFPDTATDPWNIEVQHPDEFLVHLYYLNPDFIVHILHEQAAFIGKSLSELLSIHREPRDSCSCFPIP
jgi:predicted nucleic acid-binding protein